MNTSTKRQQLLDTGVMFAIRYFRDHQRSLKQGMGFLSPTEIADHVGCSRSLIYHLWAVEDASDRGAAFEAYLGEVAEQLSRSLVSIDELVATLGGSAPTDLDEAVRVICEQQVMTMAADEQRALILTDLQLRTVAADSSRVRASCNSIDQAHQLELGKAFESLLGGVDRELQPHVTAEHLARALWAVSYGFWIESFTRPDVVDERIAADDHAWTLYGLTVRGVIESMTRPLTPVG